MFFPLCLRKNEQNDVERSIFLPVFIAWLVLVISITYMEEAHGDSIVKDHLGKSIIVPESVKRVVSFAPSMTEILFALGKGDLLVGRTSVCNYPAAALKAQVVGAYMRPDLERVIGLQPDLVLTTKSSSRKVLVDRLERLGIPVFVSDTRDINQVFDLVNRIGRLLDAEEQARELVGKLQKKLVELRRCLSGVKKPTVLFAVGVKPLFVAGGQSFIGALLREAKCVNIAEDVSSPYPKFSMDEVFRRDPDIILVLMKDCSSRESCLGTWLRYQSLKAVKNGRLYQVDADVTARPGPRVIDGLEKLVGFIHPTVLTKTIGEAKVPLQRHGR